jgi:hypothetical protein
MAVLTGTLFLTRAILTEVTENPNDAKTNVVAGTAGGVGGGGSKVDSITQDGAFRQYGNGNVRLILGSAVTRTQTFALRALTPSQVDAVESLVGQTVCYRDTYGRRVFGAYLSVAITDIPFSGTPQAGTLLTDVGLTIQSVTYTEVV